MKRLLLSSAMLIALPAWAAGPIDETRPLAADATVEVHNVRGVIRVTGSDRSDVHITGTVGEGAKGLVVEGDERRLEIRIEYPNSSGGWGWWGGNDMADSTLEVALPKGVTLHVEGVSAEIDVRDVQGQRVEIDSVSGDVELSTSAAEIEIDSVSGDTRITTSEGTREVALESVSGDVELTGPVSERLQAESVSGRLTLSPVGDLKSARTAVVSGDIELQMSLAPGGRIDAESLSGDVVITLPKSTSARLEATSFSGTIRSAVGKVEKEEFGPGSSLHAELGSGDGQIRLESFSGDAELKLQ